MLSSRRALQISGTLVAGLEKSTFLRHLQVSFNTLYSLAISLWPISSSSMIITCSWLNHFHRESYCGSLAQVLFLQKYSSRGQDEKYKSSTLYQQGSALTSLLYNFVDRVGSIPILSSNDLSFTLSCFSKRHSTRVFLVFLMAGMAWEQKWAQHLYFSRWSVWAEKLCYTTLKVSFQYWWEVLSWGGRVNIMSSFSYWFIKEK